ncbi:MAG TPA: hypothetical protein VFC57_00395, partial [Aeromicrobium sp.]|nr:hypothetical protein [Aeromicrobium sp.]
VSTDAYDNRFLPMVKTMIDDPDSKAKREALGLILFHLTDSRPGDKAAAAGHDKTYAFLGSPFDGDGYAGRAVWINPKWKRITTGVDRRLGFDRLKINLEASASMPVFNTKLKRDDMMTVATEATFIMIPRLSRRGPSVAHRRLAGNHQGRGLRST